MRLRPGEPCNHPGCLSHISHPCEGCGRTGGQGYFSDSGYTFMGFSDEVRESVPRTPWCVTRYGFSLAQVKSANGDVVLDELNIALAEFIVEKVNAKNRV